MKSLRSKSCDISQEVKKRVWERDGGRCIVCGDTNALPNAHILSRSKGGLGVEKNIVTLCSIMSKNKCHHKFDNGSKKEHDKILQIITRYMKSIYGDSWRIEDQKYKKWSDYNK